MAPDQSHQDAGTSIDAEGEQEALLLNAIPQTSEDEDGNGEEQERVELIPPHRPSDMDMEGEASVAMMVRVRAPVALPEGYTFVASINEDPSKTFTCRVPEGGVDEGMLFWAPLPSSFPDDRLQAPFGHWKDGVFNCLSLGMCHTTLWCSLCCPHLQMAQVMTRMRLNCLGQFGPPPNTQHTFLLVLSAGALYGIVSTLLAVAQLPYPVGEVPVVLSLANFVASALFTLFLVVTMCQTRRNVRRQYGIPGRSCDDLFCSLCCTCCTVAQMARHTGNYEIHPAVCCTETGHPPTAPLSV